MKVICDYCKKIVPTEISGTRVYLKRHITDENKVCEGTGYPSKAFGCQGRR